MWSWGEFVMDRLLVAEVNDEWFDWMVSSEWLVKWVTSIDRYCIKSGNMSLLGCRCRRRGEGVEDGGGISKGEKVGSWEEEVLIWCLALCECETALNSRYVYSVHSQSHNGYWVIMDILFLIRCCSYVFWTFHLERSKEESWNLLSIVKEMQLWKRRNVLDELYCNISAFMSTDWPEWKWNDNVNGSFNWINHHPFQCLLLALRCVGQVPVSVLYNWGWYIYVYVEEWP